MITFPFNFQPYSTDIKTSDYTIPAGYYAQVTGLEAVNGRIILNSKNLWNPTNCYAEYANTGAVNTNVNLLTIAEGFFGELYINSFSSAAHQLILNTQSGNANAHQVLSSGSRVNVRGLDQIYASYTAGASAVYFSCRSSFNPINGSPVWCKAGDAIQLVGSGKFLVVLYPMVT